MSGHYSRRRKAPQLLMPMSRFLFSWSILRSTISSKGCAPQVSLCHPSRLWLRCSWQRQMLRSLSRISHWFSWMIWPSTSVETPWVMWSLARVWSEIRLYSQISMIQYTTRGCSRFKNYLRILLQNKRPVSSRSKWKRIRPKRLQKLANDYKMLRNLKY
jgi:hypothetical protein